MHSPIIQNPEMQQQVNGEFAPIIHSLLHQNWGLIIGAFLFYFLGGYFIYAAMFAAVGSLVNEDPQEAQQLTLPVSMPIIFGIIILQATIKDPNSNLAIFGSLFPLTSPIVMLGRIPYGVPTWQIITSMVLLIGGFILMTWMSAKIYRTGILMYGKKPTWKEVFKWIRNS
jgi:ABC-2 type transport system permease protein